MIIERPDLIRDLESGKWMLVYGRRKTGKTFLVSNYTDHDEFFFVKRDRTIISKKDLRTIDYDTLIEILNFYIREEKTAVIDEFHRLGPDFLDQLHSMDINGRLFLISSTLHLSHSMVSSSSPLLGKVAELKVPLISYRDLLRQFGEVNRDRYEMMAFSMEPLVIGMEYRDPVDALMRSRLTVPALVGEIFSEEDRKIGATYEGILRAIASGKESSGTITSHLFSRRIFKKNDQSMIQQYLGNLMDIGLIGRINVWNRKKFVYKHNSPLIRAFYYLDEKYNISERDIERGEMDELLGKMIPHIMEDVLRSALAEELGCQEKIDHSSENEIDGILVKFKRPWAVMEVKWKEKLGDREIRSIEERLGSFDVERRFLVVPDRSLVESTRIEVIEPADIIGIKDRGR